ncbi:hypothetical protein NST99_05460 [Paenibacillus sp. FSL L8-0470]|uniref:hypothetical protein n=1 Tax=Paenibacillus sp. FSL L8-0470 TaxID=2954688 RepID=UPI0030F90CED
MTYSLRLGSSGDASDVLYLEQQIAAVKQVIKRAEAAGHKEALDEAKNKLAELEGELDKLVD